MHVCLALNRYLLDSAWNGTLEAGNSAGQHGYPSIGCHVAKESGEPIGSLAAAVTEFSMLAILTNDGWNDSPCLELPMDNVGRFGLRHRSLCLVCKLVVAASNTALSQLYIPQPCQSSARRKKSKHRN